MAYTIKEPQKEPKFKMGDIILYEPTAGDYTGTIICLVAKRQGSVYTLTPLNSVEAKHGYPVARGVPFLADLPHVDEVYILGA